MANLNQSTIESCRIDVQLVNDGVGFSENDRRGSVWVWFRFRAVADGPNGRYVVGYSVRQPLNSSADTPAAPKKNNIAHTNIWQQLVDQLHQEGWQLHGSMTGNNWWEQQFQRVREKPIEPRLLGRMWPWIVFAIIAVVAVFGLLRNVIPSQFYVRQVVPLAEMGLMESAESPQLNGKILILNADTNRVDPLHLELDESRAATRQADAESAVWIDCDSTPIPLQQPNRIVSFCQLIVVDMVAGIRYKPVTMPNSEEREPTINGGILSIAIYKPGTKVYELRDEAAMLAYINNLLPQSP